MESFPRSQEKRDAFGYGHKAVRAQMQHHGALYLPHDAMARDGFCEEHPTGRAVELGLCCKCNGAMCKYPFCCQSPWFRSLPSLLTPPWSSLPCASCPDEQMTECAITAELHHGDLWKKFHDVGTEMVLTKVGRRMFPAIEMIVSGLEKNAFYSMVLEIHCTDGNRYKYMNAKWLAVGKSDAEFPDTGSSYVHPESPNQGSSWMKQMVSFKKAKLTNHKKNTKHVVLHSLHKYEPRFTIIQEWQDSDHQQLVFTKELEECTFFAVTAYQSNQMTQLKIDYNPFAKAFRETALAVSVNGKSDFLPSRSLQLQHSKQVPATCNTGGSISSTWTLTQPRIQSSPNLPSSLFPVNYNYPTAKWYSAPANVASLHCCPYVPSCSVRPRSAFTTATQLQPTSVSFSAGNHFRKSNHHEHIFRPIPNAKCLHRWKSQPNTSLVNGQQQNHQKFNQ